MRKHAPGNAGELVGERNGEDVVMQPLLGCLEPRFEAVPVPAVRLDQYDPGGLNEQNAQVAIAALRYLAEDGAVAGRSPEAARKALNKDTILEMHRAFKLGGRKAIEKVMRNQPAVFLKLLVLL